MGNLDITINADDFGLSHTKNIAVDELMRRGICDRASLVVNTEFTDEAVELARQGGYLNRLNLHLSLTVGEALSTQIKKKKLYYNGTEFRSMPIIRSIKQILPINVKQIRSELEAQIQKILSYGITDLYVDSHNWIHLRIPVWLALKPLLYKYHIISLRPMWEGYMTKPRAGKWRYYFRIIHIAQKFQKRYYRYQYSSNIEQFLYNKVYHNKNLNTIELFVHPDYVNKGIMDLSSAYTKRGQKMVLENIQELRNVCNSL